MTEFHLPKAWHGNLIGKQGANVKYINSTFGVQVRIPPSDSNSTVVTVEGARAEEAIAEIEQKLGFKVSRTALVTVSAPFTTAEASKAFANNGLNKLMREFGVGLRAPTDTDANVTIQGSQASVDGVLAKLSESAGRTVAAAAAAKPATKPAATPAAAPAASAAPKTAAAVVAAAASTSAPTKQAKAPAAAVQKPDLSAQVIQDVLFFADGDSDDKDDVERFVRYLRSGSKTLDICVFTITSNKIADAIKAEHAQGVKVRIITDNHTADALGSDIYELAKAGIPVKRDLSEGHMHHKFCVVDGKLLMNGSFNWTQGASSVNYENVMVLNTPYFVQEFSKMFEELWADNKRFEFVK